MKQERNAPCPCGSGEKYKRCCALKRTQRQWLGIVGAVVAVVVVGWVAAVSLFDAADQAGGPPPPGKVWSEEHGHYHDVPEGWVWSEEHGHYHDAAGGELPAGSSGG